MSAGFDPVAHEADPRTPASMALLAATVFLSAFLLFQVQPIIARYILPWFGSTPGVWTTALLFFQLMLLAGYGYAHFIVSRLTWRRQAVLHVALLGVALLTLPITPAEGWKPTDADAPIQRILLILTLSVGAPYLLLSATAPLIQRWFAQLHPGTSPYRLYALSNLGSLLALLSYPFLVEPTVRLQGQTQLWSLAYVAFAVLCAGCAFLLFRSVRGGAAAVAGEGGAPAVGQSAEDDGRPGPGAILLWLLLSACGSGLLLATTNQMSIDVAVVPFLWVLPLSIYLVTFILSFDHERWYVRPLFMALLPLASMNAVRLLYGSIDAGIVDQVLGYSLTLFVCCMCCHGELAKARPPARHLTLFFLIVSIGGAVGGLFVAILAPALFRSFYEYHLLLVACYALVGLVLLRLLARGELSWGRGPLARGLVGLAWALGLGSIAVGTVVLLRPETWLEGASSHVRATFAAWQGTMRWYGVTAAVGVPLILEVWRRRAGVEPGPWWISRGGLARVGLVATLAVGLVSLGGGLVWQIAENERRMVAQERNFYGMLAIKERDAGYEEHRISLTHGRIQHGSQLQLHRDWPTSYFGPETGIAIAIQHHPRRLEPDRQFRIGVVGLGVGTIAAYGNAWVDPEQDEAGYVTPLETGVPDYMRFYELNPQVTRWAERPFTFLADARARGADVEVLEGDGRIVLERQLQQGDAQRFDVLAIDAFSSDAIPIHLITLEAVRMYLGHLNEDGILGFNVTNRFVDLLPVVRRLADAVGMNAVYIENYSSSSRMVSSADWVLLTNNRAFLDLEVVHRDEEELPAPGPLWTDDFSSLFEVVELDD